MEIENINQKKIYNKTFYDKHKDNSSIDCLICFGSYNKFNKSHHMKTKKHQKALQITEKNNN